MRALIRKLDGLLRRSSGVFEFSDEPACLFRLQVSHIPHTVSVPDGEIPTGARVLLLHVWNEHVPPIPPQGADMAWAIRTCRMLIGSLRAIAHQMIHDPALADVQAVGGVTVLIPSPADPEGGGLIRRLGFTICPYSGLLGRFGEFWENLYTWWIMWTFNAASLRRRQLIGLCRSEMWMSAAEFLRRYSVREDSTGTVSLPPPVTVPDSQTPLPTL